MAIRITHTTSFSEACKEKFTIHYKIAMQVFSATYRKLRASLSPQQCKNNDLTKKTVTTSHCKLKYICRILEKSKSVCVNIKTKVRKQGIFLELQVGKLLIRTRIACVASVSVGFSARSRHFSLFGGAKIGASATNGRTGWGGGSRTFLRLSQFSGVQKPYGSNACYAG